MQRTINPMLLICLCAILSAAGCSDSSTEDDGSQDVTPDEEDDAAMEDSAEDDAEPDESTDTLPDWIGCGNGRVEDDETCDPPGKEENCLSPCDNGSRRVCGDDCTWGACDPDPDDCSCTSVPANDACGGAVHFDLGSIGDACQAGTAECANDDYAGSCSEEGSGEVVYAVTIETSPDLYQLYEHYAMVYADFDSVLYARYGDCESADAETGCNDDFDLDAIPGCSSCELDEDDSALSIPPQPAGSEKSFFLFVERKDDKDPAFQLKVTRVTFTNNPCAEADDSRNVVNATEGGELRGNINGYINDMRDGESWLKTPCHADSSASGDWPAHAWFQLAPGEETTYTIATNEQAPSMWFDTVIGVWDNTPAGGCGGTKTYVACASAAGRDSAEEPTSLEITVPAGSTYLVGISSYERPVSGNYLVTFHL